MYCANCGRPVEEGASFCPHCGVAIGQVVAPGQPTAAPAQVPARAGPRATSSLAIASLIAGVAGLMIGCYFWPAGLAAAIIAVVLGILGLSEIRKRPGELAGNGLAIAGIVVGGISLVLAGLAIIGFTLLALTGPRIRDIFGSVYDSLQ